MMEVLKEKNSMKAQFDNIWHILNIFTFQLELVVCYETLVQSSFKKIKG